MSLYAESSASILNLTRPSAGRTSTVATVLVVTGLIVLPFLVKPFFIFLATSILVYAIAIVGMNILMGLGGQVSIGHGAFVAVGAYVTGIALAYTAIPYPVAIVLSGAICLLLGALLGIPLSKFGAVYQTLATFALAVAMPQLLRLSLLEPWTKGAMGLLIEPPSVPSAIPLEPDQWFYFNVLIVFLLLFAGAWTLSKSATGRALAAVRDNPLAASAMGVDVRFYKLAAFGLSAFYAGISGALSGLLIQFVSPDTYTFHVSIVLLVGLVVGGIGWLPGCLIGATFVTLVPNVAEHISKDLAGAIYGVALMVIAIVVRPGAFRWSRFFPKGRRIDVRSAGERQDVHHS